MNKDKNNIHVNSFKARGLRSKNKRKNIFSWFNNSHTGITMLQETHSIPTDHDSWAKEWNGSIFFSDGGANCRGVATLIPNRIF